MTRITKLPVLWPGWPNEGFERSFHFNVPDLWGSATAHTGLKSEIGGPSAEDEAHFLGHDPRTDEVDFFGTWMSRDRVWLAPLDAQSAIIKKWREWFEKNGQMFTCPRNHKLNEN